MRSIVRKVPLLGVLAFEFQSVTSHKFEIAILLLVRQQIIELYCMIGPNSICHMLTGLAANRVAFRDLNFGKKFLVTFRQQFSYDCCVCCSQLQRSTASLSTLYQAARPTRLDHQLGPVFDITMECTTRVDIDAEHFRDFLGDDDALQLFPDVLTTPLLGLEDFEPTEANEPSSSSDNQHVPTETRVAEQQTQDDGPAQPANGNDNEDVDQVISSASHTSPRRGLRELIELDIFGETIDTPRNWVADPEDSTQRNSRASSNKR